MASQYIDLPIEGSGGGGITSINGDTTAAQIIAAGTGISISTASGTTTITNTESASGPGGSSGQVQYNNSGAFGGFGSWNSAKFSLNVSNGFTTSGTVGKGAMILGVPDATHNIGIGAVIIGGTDESGDTSQTNGNTATGNNSFVGGEQSTASGLDAFCFGFQSNASGNYSASFNLSGASGESAFSAIGGNAGNTNAFAAGWGAVATGYAGTAFGLSTAQGKLQTTVGGYNVPQGSANSIGPGDLAFIVGTGSGSGTGAASNGFTVDWSGNVVAAGSLSPGGSIFFNDASQINPSQLQDTTAATSVDWNARLLLATGTAATVLNWTSQQSGTGVTTAGYAPNTSANAVFAQSTFQGSSASGNAYTISDIVTALKNYGLLA